MMLAMVGSCFAAASAEAGYRQQGPKLVGTNAIGTATQGYSVALSADGSTAIVGGVFDNSGVGAVWIYVRDSGGAWTQQAKLVGSTNSALSPSQAYTMFQGTSVALSADGNLAAVGAPNASGGTGAVYLFRRQNASWQQQGYPVSAIDASSGAQQGSSVALSADGSVLLVGALGDNGSIGAAWVFPVTQPTLSSQPFNISPPKLVGSGASGSSCQGQSVALSADGLTAVVGGPCDDDGTGAAWVFTSSNGAWTQQGSKLVGTGAGSAAQGTSVDLSSDGATALVGGPNDGGGVGAAWVFARSSGAWTQQGAKLVGAGYSASNAGVSQGQAVSLSGDGDTALIGGPNDGPAGAMWVFARTGGVWSQQGVKLVGSDAAGRAYFGSSVALATDGKTAISGGVGDNLDAGAAWIFVPRPPLTDSHDYNADGKSDIAWRHAGGGSGLWLMNGGSVIGSAGFTGIPLSYTIVGQRDFNGDGKADWLWRGTDGSLVMWYFNGAAVTGSSYLGQVSTAWSVGGTGDFDGDGKGDILWRDIAGNVAIWLMDGASVSRSSILGELAPTWTIVGVGDFNGDGKADILFRDPQGFMLFWFMDGVNISGTAVLGPSFRTWSVVGTGDFNGDGKFDILFRDAAGNIAVWLMDGSSVVQSILVGNLPTSFSVAVTGDFNGDGKSDILWRDSAGNAAVWFMNGGATLGASAVPNPGLDWTIMGQNAD